MGILPIYHIGQQVFSSTRICSTYRIPTGLICPFVATFLSINLYDHNCKIIMLFGFTDKAVYVVNQFF